MKGLCFDLDGTLIDSGRAGYKRVLDIGRSRNLPVTDETEAKLRSLWGMEPIKLINTIWADEDPRAFLTAWEEWDISHPHPAFPQTYEALVLLDVVYHLSIVTNRYLRTVAPQLDHNGLTPFFGFISTPETNGSKKPDPKSMDDIFKWHGEVGTAKEDIILIGDTVHGDWNLARALKLEFYAVTCGGVDTREKFLEAGVPEDHILESVAKLPRVLFKR